MDIDDRHGGTHRLLVLAFVTVTLGIVAAGAIPGTVAAEHANETTDRIQIVDAVNDSDSPFPDDGNLTVGVQATTNESVSELQFYNATAGTGPLRFDNGGVVNASYDNKTSFGPGDSFDATSGDRGIVYFKLNQSWRWNSIRINASAGGTAYENADRKNRSVLTANAYLVEFRNASGDTLSTPVPVAASNSSSETFRSVFAATGGTSIFHCGGVVGETCADPDTDGSAHKYLYGGAPNHGAFPVDLSLKAFDFSTANGSAWTPVPSADGNVTLNESASLVSFTVSDYLAVQKTTQIDELRIENRTSGETVQRWVNGVSPTKPPLFLSPKTDYDVVIERGSETARRPMTIPTKGFTTQQILVDGGSSPATSEVVGVVRNDSRDPVSNVTVTAKPAGWGFNAPAVNSTTTDENGVFRMQVPQTEATDLRYQFQLSSSQTTNGTLTYFPTSVDNQGDGYVIRDRTKILADLTIRQGSEVDISVVNASGDPIASGRAFTSLSQTTSATSDRTRESLVETLSLFSVFPDTSVDETVVRVPSPTTGPERNVSYNVWGNEDELCARQTDVSGESRTTSECELESGGTLNVTLDKYDSIVQQNEATPEPLNWTGYYHQNVLIVRNATTGNVTTYLGPGSNQQYMIDSSDNTLSLPVPPGDYTAELRPANQFINRTAVRNETSVSVAENQTRALTLKSGPDFTITPNRTRTDRTVRRNADNSIAVEVSDPVAGPLDDSDVNVSLRLLYRNETVASRTVPLEYNATAGTFENTSYTPEVGGGRYVAEIRASYAAGESTYNTTVRERVVVSDFTAQVRTQRQTVGPGESFNVGLRAYQTDPFERIDADKENITLTLYDRDGNRIARKTSGKNLTNGEGVIEVPGLGETGLYRIGVVIEADDGRQGIGDTWIRISNFDIEVSTDSSVYTPDETVEADVSLTRKGNAVAGAQLETTIYTESGSVSVTNSTDQNGDATIELDPDALFAGDEWESSAYMEIVGRVDTASGVQTVRAGTGIQVRAFQTDASAQRDRYGTGTDPTIGVAIPPGTGVDKNNVTATRINGNEIPDSDVTVTRVDDQYFRIELDSSLAEQGRNRVRVEVTNDGGRTATDSAGFTVSSQNVRARPVDGVRSYATGETVTVEAEVRYGNGTTVDAGESVTMELYEQGSPPLKVDTNGTTTNDDGYASAELEPESGGIHAVVVSSGGDESTFPILVNDLDTNFTDGTDPVDSYEFTPGQSDATINTSTTNSTDDGIDGEVIVRALIDGEWTELGSSDVEGGDGGITFSVPASANPGTYPVEAFVRDAATGQVDRATARIELTGGVSLETDARKPVYDPGETARIQAEAEKADGSPVADGRSVEFALISPTTERTIASGTTDDGTVTVDATIPSNVTNGEYAVRAKLDSGPTDYDGVLVSDMALSVDTNQSAYATGDTVTVNLSATVDGSPVSGAGGGVRVRLSDGSTVTESFDKTGTAPYEVEIDLPEDDAVIGTRTVEAFVRNGSSAATASTSIDVFNASESATLSVPETIVANGSDFTVGANATVDTNATLTVFSPGTASVAYQEELELNESTSLSLSDPGTYVFELSVPGVGTEIAVRNVDSGPGDPSVYVGPDTDTNATEFGDQDIYIRTDGRNMTAEVFGQDESFTVRLNRDGGEGRYGVLPAEETSSGPYLVRLDGPDSTDVDSVLIEVSN
jgi:hypothetical protein